MSDRSRRRKRGGNSIAGAFIAHRKEMRESPAWFALPDDARRVLDRIELEHVRHGGAENGRLIVTYADFTKAGVRRASISRALRQCAALGFIKIGRFGYRPQRAHNAPNSYTLTYLNGVGDSPPPTDDWQRITSKDQAVIELAAAEAPPPEECPASNDRETAHALH